MKWLDDIEKAQYGRRVKPTEDEVSNVQRGTDVLQYIAGYIKKSPLGKVPGSVGSALGLLDSHQNNRKVNPADVVGLFPFGVTQLLSETLDQSDREKKYMEQFAKKSRKTNPKIEIKETAPVIKDNFKYGGEFFGTTNEGFNYNGAWGGPAQDGASMPGSVGFSYARIGAPSNGPYAKKTIPSAQNGKKVKDIRKSTDLLKVPMWAAANQEEEYIPITNNIKDVQKRDVLAKTAAKDFTAWYTNPATIQRYGKNTGMDPRRLGDQVGRALKTPSEEYSSDDPRRIENNAQYFSPLSESNKYGRIRYNKQTKDDPSLGYIAPNQNAAIQHEFAHAGSIDDVLGPALMRTLGNPYKQKKNYLEGVKDYLSQPQEAYGNFHQMRIELGLKPGQKIDVPTLQKLIEQKKLESSNFYKTFDDEKIVKAINTIASINKQEASYFTKSGGVVKDNNGYWDPKNHGKIVEIDSNNITMKGVNQPLIGIGKQSGTKKLMKPGKNYNFANDEQVIEYPLAKDGSQLTKLDQLTNWTNYNKPQKGGWLDSIK